MKVILLDYVYKHGVAGEVIEVADGYARNYLIPRGLAVKATAGEMRRVRDLREQAAAKRAALEERINELASLIDGVELVFGRRASSTGTLFGSVTTQDIAEALLEKTGADINRRRISQQSLRETGTHRVPVRLGTDLSPELKITILNEQDYAEHLDRLTADAGEGGETEQAESEAEAEVAAAVAHLEQGNPA
ncbi:MAG: 50S ribosomal protein L9 [Anaerolineaceae bacterium]|nr:50S ribosomal protein L9 [Anaerolineaceae bacterium]MCY3935396.1 50S ribosomal protein L9 [Chloroflexota bacterium]MCY4009655.1 50S ribosomal protein L9 [Anaerolineaceae bacterium]MCY4105538.1 50S ribosomal protein L9 [Chloroflexota bacterium]